MNIMTFSSLALVSISTLAFTAGCGSSVVTGNTGGGGGGTGTTGTTMTTSTGNGGACAGFEDQTGIGKVTVHIVNESPVPIYLPGTCSLPGVAYTITPQLDDDGATYVYETACLQTCADLQTQPPFVCDACAPSAIRVDPGGLVEVEWDGTGLLWGVKMPDSCYFDGSFASDCGRVVAASAGTYVAGVKGFSECGPGCTCDANGVCDGYPMGQMASATPTTFGFPGTTSIDIVFEMCTFGCPVP